MSIFSKLFKFAQPPTLEQRIADLTHLDTQQLVDVLTADEPEKLKLEAIKHIGYSSGLIDVACNRGNQPPHVAQAARKRIGEFLDEGKIDLNQISGDVQDQQILVEICGFSSQAGDKLVETISDPALLLDIAQNGTTTHIRQAAAQKIEDKNDLDALYSHAKGKDKSVYRIVKLKLDAFKQEKRKIEQFQEELASFCHQAEQLSKHKVDDIFHARLAQLHSNWGGLSQHSTPELQNRFDQAIDQCQQKIRDIEEREQQERDRQEADREAKKDVYNLIDRFTTLILQAYSSSDVDGLKQELESLLQQKDSIFGGAESRGLNCGKEKATFDKLLHELQALIHAIEAHGPFVELVQPLKENLEEASAEQIKVVKEYLRHFQKRSDTAPEIVSLARELVNSWHENKKRGEQQRMEANKSLNDLLRRGQWAINNGHVGRARAILRDAQELVETATDLSAPLRNKFDDYLQSVNKLGDWHDFAVTPKKQALVEEMQSLKGGPLTPPELADKIQSLQTKWKELCRGGQNQDEELWQTFHAASQEAYEPCKQYFEQQNQFREENASKRRTLIQQLNEYLNGYDWESANWPEVENTLKIAREGWQSYWPIPRQDIKVLQGQFDSVMDALHGKLNQEHEKNRVKKQALVERAGTLDKKETQEAVEEVKNLQRQWRDAGRCKRKDDHLLWKQFREHCDAVFERRQEENDQVRSERSGNLEKAQTVLSKLKAITECDEESFFSEKANVDSLSEEFNQLGELPKEHVRDIKSQYHKALEAIEHRAANLREKQALSNWHAILKIADQIRQVEQQEASQQGDLGSLESIINEHDKWPGNAQKIIQQRLHQLASSEPLPSSEEAAAELRTLCIKAEIAEDKESPAEDKALRMEYQVSQLQKSFQQSAADRHHRESLLEEWIAVRAAPDSEYQTLLDRFSNTLGL